MTLVSGTLARPDGAVDGWVETDGERIASLGEGSPPRAPDVEHDGLVAAGLCDLQVAGATGVEVTDGPEALDRIDAALLARGVTAYLPTVITNDPEVAASTVRALAERAADPASPVEGIHLEGPFLSERFRGIHRAEHLRTPDRGVPDYYRDPAVRLVTLAPELPGALDLTAELAGRGVTVSLGHSDASAEVAAAALERGARCVTHVFNATLFHHRAPGLPGWALVEDRVHVCAIADGVHLAPEVLRLVARSAGDRAVLVSDACPGAAAPPGRYRFGGTDVERTAEGRSQSLDGALAGSTALLDESVRNWSEATGTTVAEALVAAGERPARLAGIDIGLREGARADLVLASRDGRIERTMRRGAWL